MPPASSNAFRKLVACVAPLQLWLKKWYAPRIILFCFTAAQLDTNWLSGEPQSSRVARSRANCAPDALKDVQWDDKSP
jgi:hypothetical protein